MMGTDPQIYEDFINGNYNVEDVTNVLSTYSRLMEYVAPDHSSRDWYETSGQLVAGTYAMQIMGGISVASEHRVNRIWRDLRVDRISGGTDEMMILTTAKNALKKYR